MIRLIILIFCFIAPIFGRSQNTKIPIIDIFDIRHETSDSSRAVSFALWYNEIITTSGSQVYLESLGIKINSIETALSLNSKEDSKISLEFDFYTEQELGFREKLQKYLKTELPSIKNNFDKILSANPIAIIVVRTDKKDEFHVGLKNSGNEKIKLKNIVFANKNAAAVAPWTFSKPSGKLKKIKLPSLPLFQTFKRSDSNEVPIEIIIGGMTITYSLAKVIIPKPYIRKFFSSAKSTIEGEKITLTWEILGAKNVIINNEIGTKSPKWQLMFSPINSTDFELSATNQSGTSTAIVSVETERIVLTGATITYFSANNADPKEKGTVVNLKVFDMDSKEVVSHSGLSDLLIGSAIPYTGPFDLTINGIVHKRDLKKGNFKVDITSPKNDIWTFSPILILNFSDGSQNKLYGYGNKSISTDKEFVQFDF